MKMQRERSVYKGEDHRSASAFKGENQSAYRGEERSAYKGEDRSMLKGDLGTSIGVTQKSQVAYDSFAMFDNNSMHSQFSTSKDPMVGPATQPAATLNQTIKVETQEYNTIQVQESNFHFLGSTLVDVNG